MKFEADYAGSGDCNLYIHPKEREKSDYVGCVGEKYINVLVCAPEMLEMLKRYRSDLACRTEDSGDFYMELHRLIERADKIPVAGEGYSNP